MKPGPLVALLIALVALYGCGDPLPTPSPVPTAPTTYRLATDFHPNKWNYNLPPERGGPGRVAGAAENPRDV